MPALLFMAACDKVLYDADASPTLVGVFFALRVKIKKEVLTPPPNAVSLKEWCVFVFWRVEPESRNKKFVQQVRVLFPDGTEYGHIAEELHFERPTHNVRSSVPGMPIGQEGMVKIIVWLEKDGKRVTEDAKCDIEIIHGEQ